MIIGHLVQLSANGIWGPGTHMGGGGSGGGGSGSGGGAAFNFTPEEVTTD